MRLADWTVVVSISAVLLTVVYSFTLWRRHNASETPIVDKQSAILFASSTASGGSEPVIAPLSAIASNNAATQTGHQSSDSAGHSISPSSHGDIGGFSNTSNSGGH